MRDSLLPLFVALATTTVSVLAALLVATLGRTVTADARPELDEALQVFAKSLRRVRRSHLPTGMTRVEGLLRGERLWVTEWPDSPRFRSEVGIEAVVPVPRTETFVRGAGGPRTATGREPHASLREPGPDQALRALLQHVDEVKLGLSGLEARSRSALGERSLVAVADALIALAGFVRTDALPRPEPVARLLATRTRAPAETPRVVVRGKQVCPFCRDGIDERATDAVACEECTTLHHGDCWAENHGRCTVRGCGADRAERVSDL